MIADIIVESRARSENGWLDDLERSIERLGVLQPIGVTPSNVLIFGARRLQACKNLGLDEIPARVIDIDADDPVTALRMEQAENNIRKDFTPMEKVEIARRIEEAMAGRRGVRHDTDRGANICMSGNAGPSRDIAAQAVGWSGEQYRKAKKVAESDDEEVKAAMNTGSVSVNKAYKAVTGKQKLTVNIRLAYDVSSDAGSIIAKAGGEYATKLALAILESEGHEVNL